MHTNFCQFLTQEAVLDFKEENDDAFGKFCEVRVNGFFEKVDILRKLLCIFLTFFLEPYLKLSTNIFVEVSLTHFKISDVSIIELEKPSNQYQLHFSVLQRQTAFSKLMGKYAIHRTVFLLNLKQDGFNTFFEVFSAMTPLVEVVISLSNIF